jgi:hypothetical protein
MLLYCQNFDQYLTTDFLFQGRTHRVRYLAPDCNPFFKETLLPKVKQKSSLCHLHPYWNKKPFSVPVRVHVHVPSLSAQARFSRMSHSHEVWKYSRGVLISYDVLGYGVAWLQFRKSGLQLHGCTKLRSSCFHMILRQRAICVEQLRLHLTLSMRSYEEKSCVLNESSSIV